MILAKVAMSSARPLVMLVADLPVESLEFANLNYDKNVHVKRVVDSTV